MAHTVYILYSRSLNKYYTGETENLNQRLEFHKNAPSHKFTAKAKDWEVFLTIRTEDRSHSLKIEKHIKDMKSSIYIQNLKKYPEMQDQLIKRFET